MSTMIKTLYKPVEQNTFNVAQKIKLLICDVDGVFSDGLIYMGNNGEELKTFHTRDGYGVKSLMKSGVEFAIITGRKSRIVENRMNALGISLLYQGQEDKLTAYNDICDKLNIAPEHTGYIGDDLIDWPVMEKVALKAAQIQANIEDHFNKEMGPIGKWTKRKSKRITKRKSRK